MFDFSINSEVFVLIYPYTDLSSFSLFFSAETTQAFLRKNYAKNQVEGPDQKSYENCYPFIYYLEHGLVYYEQAKTSPLILQPILLFYGFVHLIKACILTIDPNYPETTSVLAHGVSTRKRKKQDYHFFQDEVKLQKTGLFPFMAERLFSQKHLEGEKIIMEDLLKQVPELTSLFEDLEGVSPFLLLTSKEQDLQIPKQILDAYHMSADRFIEFFQSKTNHSFTYIGQELHFSYVGNKYENVPFLKYHKQKATYSIPVNRDGLTDYHEILIHYLLLYNLSMIARYETEWWSELVKTMPNRDFPFIKQFLTITLGKGPFLVFQFLMGKR